MKISENAIEAVQEEIGADLAAGVGDDDDQRRIIRTALEAAMSHIAVSLLIKHADEMDRETFKRIVRDSEIERLIHLNGRLADNLTFMLQAFRDFDRGQLAKAWDEGHEAGARNVDAADDRDASFLDNPYREERQP